MGRASSSIGERGRKAAEREEGQYQSRLKALDAKNTAPTAQPDPRFEPPSAAVSSPQTAVALVAEKSTNPTPCFITQDADKPASSLVKDVIGTSMEPGSTQPVLPVERNTELWALREQIGVAGMFTLSFSPSTQLKDSHYRHI